MKKLMFVIGMMATGLVGNALADLTTIDGKSVAGEVLSVSHKDVIVSVNGAPVTLKLKQLTDASQAEAIAAAKAANTWNPYPPITVQVQVPPNDARAQVGISRS